MKLIILARMGSSRLPGKHLLTFSNKKTAIEILINELLSEFKLKKIIICTSNSIKDDLLVDFLMNLYPNITIHRGDENNVLERIYSCVKNLKSSSFVRINADNTLTSALLLKGFINIHKALDLDYTCNTENRSLPKGVSFQIIKTSLFIEYYKKVKSNPGAIEHVFLDMKQYTKHYANISIDTSRRINQDNLALDDKEDYNRINMLLTKAKKDIYYEG